LGTFSGIFTLSMVWPLGLNIMRAVLFAVLHLSSPFHYVLSFKSSSENMISLHQKEILISENDQGSAVGFVSTPSPCFIPLYFMSFCFNAPYQFTPLLNLCSFVV
jgi:hypothetical protein